MECRRATQVSEWRVGKDGTNSKFNKVEVKRINYDTLETSLPEPQMRGKQVRQVSHAFLFRFNNRLTAFCTCSCSEAEVTRV